MHSLSQRGAGLDRSVSLPLIHSRSVFTQMRTPSPQFHWSKSIALMDQTGADRIFFGWDANEDIPAVLRIDRQSVSDLLVEIRIPETLLYGLVQPRGNTVQASSLVQISPWSMAYVSGLYLAVAARLCRSVCFLFALDFSCAQAILIFHADFQKALPGGFGPYSPSLPPSDFPVFKLWFRLLSGGGSNVLFSNFSTKKFIQRAKHNTLPKNPTHEPIYGMILNLKIKW